MEIALQGIGVSPGIAMGPAVTFGLHSLEIPEYEITDTDAELKRFEQAVEAVRQDLRRLKERMAREAGERNAAIFDAHLMVLEDVVLREDLEQRLVSEQYNVEYILNDLIERQGKIMESVEDPTFRERMQDILDVGKRVLGKLLHTELESLEHLDHPSIIVAQDLSPSDTAKIDLANAKGIITDMSGPTSHTAILARAFAIPTVVGLKTACTYVHPGDTIILDGVKGDVVIRPTQDTIDKYLAAQRDEERRRQALLCIEETSAPARTTDGHEIDLLANVELPVEVTPDLASKCGGVGLYRTEYLFLDRTSLPTEEEQYQAYSKAAETLGDRPVILRTLDLGGDKFASHLQLAEELNPQLGWRAIRFCLERPDIFKAQLRAMLRASVRGNVSIMFPLISGVDELLRVKAVVKEVCADLERRSVPFRRNIQMGSMIEVPSAVAVADHLAQECDFFSIGTNDLIQYSLAVDRVNEKIAHLYEPAHPAILRMIKHTVKAAKRAGIPCGICGEMAGDPVFTEVLMGLGLSSLSMSSIAIPEVRAEVENTSLEDARKLADSVMEMHSVKEIRQFMQEHHEAQRTIETCLERYAAQSSSTENVGME